MTVYFVAAVKDPAAVWARASDLFSEDERFHLAHDKFFVSFDGTSDSLSEKLGIKDGSVGTGLILAVTSYNGRLVKATWEWLTRKMEK